MLPTIRTATAAATFSPRGILRSITTPRVEDLGPHPAPGTRESSLGRLTGQTEQRYAPAEAIQAKWHKIRITDHRSPPRMSADSPTRLEARSLRGVGALRLPARQAA